MEDQNDEIVGRRRRKGWKTLISILIVPLLSYSYLKIASTPRLDWDGDLIPMMRTYMMMAKQQQQSTTTTNDEQQAPEEIKKNVIVSKNNILKGLRIVITGATSGIGKGIVLTLVEYGATVIALGRSSSKLLALKQEIQQQSEESSKEIDKLLIPITVELNDLNSTFHATQKIRRDFTSIDILINNAGIHYIKNDDNQQLTTPQGYDSSFTVNYLSHVLLTEQLHSLLIQAPRPVIVQVSSSFHWAVDGSDLNPQINNNNNDNLLLPPLAARPGGGRKSTFSSYWRNQRVYANSKLAQLLHMRVLQQQQQQSNNTSNKVIRIVSACPGWVGTSIGGHPGSLVYTLMNTFAFSSREWGLSSLLRATFSLDDDNNNDFFINTLFSSLPVTFGASLFTSRWASKTGIRDLTSFLMSQVMFFFQTFLPTVGTEKSSPESYDMELAQSLHNWSLQQLKEFL